MVMFYSDNDWLAVEEVSFYRHEIDFYRIMINIMAKINSVTIAIAVGIAKLKKNSNTYRFYCCFYFLRRIEPK